jgi:hypothetical protein
MRNPSKNSAKKRPFATPSLIRIIRITTTAAALALTQSAHAQQWGYPEELKSFLAPAAGSKATTAPILVNIRQMEERGLLKARLAETPWTSDFWPDIKGSIADPYIETGAGPLQRNRALWTANSAVEKIFNGVVRENRPFIVGRDELRKNILSASPETIDNLSPAEKYDLLLGDKDFTFTNRVIEMVDVRDAHGLVNFGAGLCHGWAPASLNVPRPEKAVTLMSPLGMPVKFYPEDIKALAIFLWGKTNARTSFHAVGWKCQTGGKQNERGRAFDPRCFGANPAFFHLVAVNQIGLNSRGFAMDKSKFAGVWNHPIYGYKISFFDPKDTSPNPHQPLSFKEAKVTLTEKDRKDDPFKRFRAPGTKALVGVHMKVYYGNETRHPKQREYDDAELDKTKDMTIRYELELDANDNIIGGEWRDYDDPTRPRMSETHAFNRPSIVWLAPEGTKVWSVGDYLIKNVKWDGQGMAPREWLQASRTKASLYSEIEVLKGKEVSIPTPQPLGPVVDLLVELSRK